jgi:hypothetical protein
MRTSAMHAAIAAAVDLLRAEPAMNGVDIIDGPPFEWNPLRVNEQRGDGRRYLFIGADPDGEDGDSATGNQEWAGTGLPRDKDERFSITCVGILIDGGEDMRACRGELFDVLSTLESVLLAHIDLGDGITAGPVLYSGFAGVERLRQFFTDRGLTISAQFNIDCRAFLTS